MTALTHDVKRPQLGGPSNPIPSRLGFPVEANTVHFGGGLVAVNAAGNAIRPQTGGALYVPGVAHSGVNNLATNTPFGAAGAQNIDVEVGCFAFLTDGSLSGDLFTSVYAVDDTTVSASSNGGVRPYVGYTIQNPLLGGVSPVSTCFVMVGFANPYQLPEQDTAPVKDVARCVIGALPGAYTGSGTGTLTAVGNGAITAQNGCTLVAGDVAWLAAGATNISASKDSGPMQVVQVGSASTQYILTRPFFWSSGQPLIPGRSVGIGGDDTKFGGSRMVLFAVKGKLIDTDPPLAYPDNFIVQQALTSGAATITGIPIHSTTKSCATVEFISGNASVSTVSYTAALTAGEIGTGGGVTAGSIAISALAAGQSANANGSETVVVKVSN